MVGQEHQKGGDGAMANAQVVGYVPPTKKATIRRITKLDRHLSESAIVDKALTEEFLRSLENSLSKKAKPQPESPKSSRG
jgi:hypothetical protein